MDAIGEQGPGAAAGEIEPEAGAGKAGVPDGVGTAVLAAGPALIGALPAMGAAGAERGAHEVNDRAALEQRPGVVEDGGGGAEQAGMAGALQRRAVLVVYLAREDAAAPGTALRNDHSGEIVYVPPQDQRDINLAMSGLERFVNDDALSTLDPLIKMALIHHQFESIHPFPDGNGRIGRILNVLYLTRVGLLEIPILYLSRAINNSKGEYYRLLQHVRDTGEWKDWLIYMLRAVDETAKTTLDLVENIRQQMATAKKRLRTEFPKIYSQDLLNNLFRHPYTRIDYVQKELNVTRQTAARYLDALADAGILSKHQSGRNNYYINEPLIALFLKVSE